MLLSKECLAGLAQLRESIVHHLLFAIDVSIAHLVELIDAFLGNSLVVMLLLGAKVLQVVVHFGEGGRLFVHFLVSGHSL